MLSTLVLGSQVLNYSMKTRFALFVGSWLLEVSWWVWVPCDTSLCQQHWWAMVQGHVGPAGPSPAWFLPPQGSHTQLWGKKAPQASWGWVSLIWVCTSAFTSGFTRSCCVVAAAGCQEDTWQRQGLHKLLSSRWGNPFSLKGGMEDLSCGSLGLCFPAAVPFK